MAFDFDTDLLFGEQLELEVVEKFNGKHKLRKIEGYHKEYDLICDDCGVTIECKNDRYESGNMAFELPMLSQSTADILIYRVMGKTYWGRLEDIRYWLRLGHKLGLLKLRKMGENGNKGYVVPIDDTRIFMTELWRVNGN